MTAPPALADLTSQAALDSQGLLDFLSPKIDEARIETLIRQHFDLRPKGIIQMLDLLRLIYRKTAASGHFWRRTAAGL